MTDTEELIASVRIQKACLEMDRDEYQSADFQYGYDAVLLSARKLAVALEAALAREAKLREALVAIIKVPSRMTDADEMERIARAALSDKGGA